MHEEPHQTHHQFYTHKSDKRNETLETISVVLLMVAILALVFNQFQLISLSSAAATGNAVGIISTQAAPSGIATGISAAEAAIVPKGTPEIYGKELKVSYDDVNANNPGKADSTIAILGDLDRTIDLAPKDLERYIDITSEISCEYCCGAASIIVTREDVANLNEKIEAAIKAGQITEAQAKQYRATPGTPACGCAHSFAMRGLAKYLIQKHGSEYTDEQILDELAKWKTLFFPGAMAAKAAAMKQQGIEFSYANLGSNRYRGIEKGSSASGGSGSMVGGC